MKGRKMRKTVLDFPKAGEGKLYGYAGSMVAFTIENQLLDAEKWALVVWGILLRPCKLAQETAKTSVRNG